MNQLRVIESSCLHIAFLDRQKLLIAGRKIYGERMTSKKKTILERDQRFFVAAFFQKWIKTMLIRSAIFVWITLKYVIESTDKLLSLHLIVTLVSRAFQDCLEFDCYVSISQVSRLLFHSIVKWVSGTRLGLYHTMIVTLIFRTFYASLSFHCYLNISHSFRVIFQSIVMLESGAFYAFLSIYCYVSIMCILRIIWHSIVTWVSCAF